MRTDGVQADAGAREKGVGGRGVEEGAGEAESGANEPGSRHASVYEKLRRHLVH